MIDVCSMHPMFWISRDVDFLSFISKGPKDAPEHAGP